MHILSMAVVAVTLAINFMPLSAQAQETINSPTKNVLLLGNGIFGSENYTSQNLALNDYDGTIDFISEDFSTSQSLIDSTYKETFYNYLKNIFRQVQINSDNCLTIPR